jgi:hypothetical protein
VRNIADGGFLVRRTDISHYHFGDGGLSTGAVPLYVEGPELVVRLRRSSEPAPVDSLPPATDVNELAGHLKAEGGDGYPTTRELENLEELVQQWRARRRGDMPDWMWERVQEVWNLPFYLRGGPVPDSEVFTTLLKGLDSADPERYRQSVMRWELDKPPGWFRGHSHSHDILPLKSFPELLTDVIRYDRALSFVARWPEGLELPDMDHHYRVLTLTGTFNHMAQARPKALIGAEVSGLHWLVKEAIFGIFALNRKMVYTCGYSQELGDSYYRGIALVPLQGASRFSDDPLMRLKTSLMMEKLLFTDISTYHPGLRHRVSRVSRRMGGLHQFILHQDAPEAMLHMLSRDGVLIETDRLEDGPEVHGLPIIDMHATPPVQVALAAPWGREWESHAVDDKQLPFTAMFKMYGLGGRDEPVHAATYMGNNYAIGSEQLMGGSVPIFAVWRTEARKVERVPDKGIMMLQGRVNDTKPDIQDKTPMGSLPHKNKLIWAIKPHERHFLEAGAGNIPSVEKEGLYNLRAQVAIHTWGRAELPEVWIGDDRVEEMPATATHDDIIFVRDGVSYIGLIPFKATDLGRDADIRIDYDAPSLTIASHILDRKEPVELTEEMWSKIAEATAGWVVEFGDVDEHGSFDAFRAHIQNTVFQSRYDAAERVLHLSYESGGDLMEMGFRTDFERHHLWHRSYHTKDVFAYQRVNGQDPWLPEEIYMESPLGVMGWSEKLEKGGAVLTTAEGQMAFLRVEPISRTYTGINPFLDPTGFKLTTPEGVEIISEGPLTLGRVTARPEANELWVDYQIPKDVHAVALKRVREDMVLAPGGEYVTRWHLNNTKKLEELLDRPRPAFFPAEDIAPENIAQVAARALLVRGFDGPPRVILNEKELAGPFARMTKKGVTYYRIPIAEY